MRWTAEQDIRRIVAGRRLPPVPRGERPLESDGGPLTAFAAELRALRAAAGGPGYRELARRAHYSSSALSDAASGRRLPSLDVTLGYVRACDGDEDAWRRRWHSLAAELARAEKPITATEPRNGAPAPYVGLAAFGADDSGRFFGREAVTAKLLAKLSRQRFLALFGASGEGKSSVLHAGLVSRWAKEHRVVLTPGPDPVEELAVRLARLTGRSPTELHDELRNDPRAFHLVARALLVDEAPDTDLLVVVDQFEELFTLCKDNAVRARFIDLLLTAAQAHTSRVRVVLGVRSDFYPHCARHADLAQAVEDGQVLLGVMTVDELRRAITRPAAAVGCAVEAALVAQVVADAAERPGVLPLVSHALVETWHRRRGNTLTMAGYQAAGGIRSALARTAEAVYGELGSVRQDLARQVLLRLTAPGEGTDDTKRRVPRAELTALGDEVDAVVQTLVSARLITVTDEAVDITHEALFQAWPRLRGWLDEDRAGLRVHRHLIEATAIWEELDRDPGVLFRTGRLAATVDWVARAKPALTRPERDFLDASAAVEAGGRRATRRRRRVLVTVVAVLVCASAAVLVPVMRQLDLAERVELSRSLAAQSAEDLTTSARLSLRAYAAHPTVEARSRLITTALSRQDDPRRIPLGDDAIGRVALSPDGSQVAVAHVDRVVLWSTTSLDRVGELATGTAGPAAGMRFSPDGRVLVVGDSSGNVDLWDIAEGKQVRTFTRAAFAYLTSFALSPDGRTLVAAYRGDAVHPQPLVSLWDTATGDRIGDLDTQGKPYYPLGFSDDGRTLAMSTTTEDVELWDIESRTRTAQLGAAGEGRAVSLAFSPDGGRLAVGYEGGAVLLWDTTTKSRALTASRHAGGAYSVAMSPDGSVLASAGTDGRLALWSIPQRTSLPDPPVHSTSTRTGLGNTAFARNGTLIATSARHVLIWSADQLPIRPGNTAVALEYDDTGTLHALQRTGALTTWLNDSSLRVAERRELVGDGTWSATGVFSPDGRKVAVGAPGGPVAVWNVTGGRPSQLRLSGWPPGAALRMGAFSADGRAVLPVVTGQPVAVWDTDRPDEATVLLGSEYTDYVTSAEFIPGGSLVALGDQRGKVKVWSRHDVRWVAELDHSGPVMSIATSPDGRLLATSGVDRVVVLWDTGTWREVARMSGHVTTVRHAEFSPDGARLATAGADGTIVLWDVATRSPWAVLNNPSGPATALAWSADNKSIATASDNGTIAVWNTDVGVVIDDLCDRVAEPGGDASSPPEICRN
ncbi:MAG: helix-turn-helix domain-containing protein [Saccharothrix sp.]|nr:helix-turn-helix domain-containing protein [Saccharothrix sp.]